MKELCKAAWNRIPKKWEWVTLGGVFFLSLSLWTLSRSKSYPKDNFVEEFLETIIEEKTGQLIDLSPDSPE
ncbi:MAG: hypothetical protein ACRDAI_05740 [Candidatus Rhabdochlamydia sp.]